MKVLVFGGSGMIGQGVIRECLRDTRITRVLAVSRSPLGLRDPKLAEIVHSDFFDLRLLANELRGYDTCFFSLGVSAVGLTEDTYHHLTYDLTLSVATAVLEQNPRIVFEYISGMGTDSSERGVAMWARVKGKTENALLRLGFQHAYMLRPFLIQPLDGIRSKTRLYRLVYTVLRPLSPLLLNLFPGYVTTTERLARAMIDIARHGFPSRILESRDINVAANRRPPAR